MEEIKELKKILQSLHEIETSFSVEFDYDLPRALYEASRHASIAAQHLERYLGEKNNIL